MARTEFCYHSLQRIQCYSITVASSLQARRACNSQDPQIGDLFRIPEPPMAMQEFLLLSSDIIRNLPHVIDNKRLISKRRIRTEKKGGPYLKDRAIMLLKTHIEKMSYFCLTTMLMKTHGLNQFNHDVDENTGSYRNWLYLLGRGPVPF